MDDRMNVSYTKDVGPNRPLEKPPLAGEMALPEAMTRLWMAIGDRIEEWDAKAKEAANPSDVNLALGVASGLRMAMVMVRRVRDGEEPHR